jgi:hypothetical protein
MCYVPLIRRACCDALWDPADMNLPILEPCAAAQIDPSREEDEGHPGGWTGCTAREQVETTDMD